MTQAEARGTHDVSEGRVRAARLSVVASALSFGLFAVPPVNSIEVAFSIALLLALIGVASGIRALLSWRFLPTSHRCLAVGGVVAGTCVPLFVGYLLWLFATFPNV